MLTQHRALLKQKIMSIAADIITQRDQNATVDYERGYGAGKEAYYSNGSPVTGGGDAYRQGYEDGFYGRKPLFKN